jgi:hypothetical protein
MLDGDEALFWFGDAMSESFVKDEFRGDAPVLPAAEAQQLLPDLGAAEEGEEE